MGRAADRQALERQAGHPFPVAPEDVPIAAVRAVQRTLLRNDRQGIDDLARLIVAVVIAALHNGVTPTESGPVQKI